MKNKKSSYDFFAKEYSDSQGEEGDYYHKTQIDPYIYKSIGNPKGKTIYDIGCGNGYMARHIAKMGGIVFASDISPKLIKIAKDRSKNLKIKYFVEDAISFRNIKNQKFDIVILNMVINYIGNIDLLFSKISNSLKNNGKLVFSTNHPIRPEYPYSQWEKGKVGNTQRLFIKVTNYLKDIKFKVNSGWDQKTKLNLINRPFGRYVNTLSKHKLFLTKIYEPESVGFAIDFTPQLQKTHHIPTFIVYEATKKS